MRRALLTVACALACLCLVGQATAGSAFGVADNHPVGMKDDGDAFYTLMHDLGMTENRITVLWDRARPTTISRKAELERALAQARAHGIEVVLAVYPLRATVLASPAAQSQFVTFVQLVANSFPDVTTFVIGNEFNEPAFYQPQFGSNCRRLAGGSYMRLLARGYDALKAVNPDITVISSVSPRGNDDCRAKNNRSTSPVRFVHEMGVAFRALSRNRPAFDEFGIHLYPNQPTDSIDRGYAWPKIGASNLDRLKQSLWDAFHGTAQPAPGWQPALLRYGQSISALHVMKIWNGEIGWQVGVRTGGESPYYGRENVQVTTEARQAQIYSDLVERMTCDSTVDAMLFFGLVDEPDLGRFQAGLLRADWTKRPAYSAVKQAIAGAKDGCQGRAVQWQPTGSVLGAGVDFGKLRVQPLNQRWWGFSATAREDATYSAGIFHVQGRQVTQHGRQAIFDALSGKGGATPALAEHNVIHAYWSPIVRFPSRRLTRGSYVYGIRLAAAMNTDRTTVFVSTPFKVGR